MIAVRVHHTAGHEGMFGQILTEFPLPDPQEPPYVPAVLPTGGSMDYPIPDYNTNSSVVLYVGWMPFGGRSI